MDRLIFNQTGGFPLTTDILNALQNAYNIFNAMSGLAGDLTILSGCEQTGNTIADGVVAIAGEVLAFKGGQLDTRVRIVENVTQKTFEDGEAKGVILTRYVTFGGGTSTYNWADFKRITNLKDFNTNVFTADNSVEKRLKKLEERVTKTVPIGLVAIWDRPADEIPEGWVEHTDLQGFTPVGQKKNDTDFGTLGATLGEKKHTLTISEIPQHSHEVSNLPKRMQDTDRGVGNSSYFSLDDVSAQRTAVEGGGKSHNNIQPSRIVRFIRFVGFN